MAADLTETGCFENLTEHPQIEKRVALDGRPLIVTCIALKPSNTAITQRAWELLQSAKEKKDPIASNIHDVFKEGIVVDVYGLKVEMNNAQLSLLEIRDARRYFRPNDEIVVNVNQVDEANNIVVLSNNGTDTDPKRLVDEFQEDKEKPMPAQVKRVLGSEGWQIGLIVEFAEKKLDGFIPRNSASYSRFSRLSDTYPVGRQIMVMLDRFDTAHKTFLCHVHALEDPWSHIDKYAVDSIVTAVVRQISKRYVVCELESGLEGSISFDEISWGVEDEKIRKLNGYEPGQSITTKILEIDSNKRRVLLSPKRLTESPVETFLRDNEQSIVCSTVTKVGRHFAFVSLSEGVEGYLHVREFMWSYCEDMEAHLSVEQRLEVKLLSYDPSYDNIKVSYKQCIDNSFSTFSEQFAVGDIVFGVLKWIVEGRLVILLTFDSNLHVEAYVHKSELSNSCFVDQPLMERILSPGQQYGFVIKRIDNRNRVVELSRKAFLKQKLGQIYYGEEYEATAVCFVKGRLLVCSDEFEGFIVREAGLVAEGSRVRVMPIRIDTERTLIEFQLT